MFIFFIFVNAYSAITGIICLICLIFLFFESAFGICLGCLLYPVLFKDKAQYCPGEICDVKQKHAIQKTSITQILALLLFIAFIVITVWMMNDSFSVKPYDLFGNTGIEHVK